MANSKNNKLNILLDELSEINIQDQKQSSYILRQIKKFHKKGKDTYPLYKANARIITKQEYLEAISEG